MLKQLKTTLKKTISISVPVSLAIVTGAGLAWSQVQPKSTKTNAPNFTKLTNRPTAYSVPFKPDMSKAYKQKFAYYKRAETLSQTASLSAKQVSDEKIVSGSASIAQMQSLYDYKDGSKKSGRSYILAVNTKISSAWNFLTRITYEQDLRDVENPEGGFSDLVLILGKNPSELADWLKGSPSLSVVLPTSKVSKDYQNLQASIGVGYKFALTPVILAKGFDFSLTFSGARNFHQYDTDTSGKVLNAYSLRETLSGAYSIKDWTFSTDLIFRHGFSYRGSVSQAFEHSEEIGYAITPRWSVSAGHTNSGAWLKPNGQDSNLSLIDENSSIFYGSTSVSF